MQVDNCNSPFSHNWRSLRTVKSYHIVQCSRCGLIGTQELLSPDFDGAYKVDERDEERFLKYALPARLVTWERFWNRIEPFKTHGELLEAGSGYGHFLLEAGRRGWQAQGVEPGEYPAWVAQNRQNVSVWKGKLEEFPIEICDFDVMVLWDVIEHVPDPIRLLQRCWKRLRPGGALLVRTPDAQVLTMSNTSPMKRFLLNAYIQLVYPANPAEHIYHFTPEVLTEIIISTGFKISWIDRESLEGEVALYGRNPLVTVAKKLVHTITKNMHLPREFTVLAIKVPCSESLG